MRLVVFEKINARLSQAVKYGDPLEDIISDNDLESWETSWNAVGSIYAHLYKDHIKATTPMVRRKLHQLTRRYFKMAGNMPPRDDVIIRLAQEVNYSPFLLARLIVGQKYKIAKKELARTMRDPEKLISDKVLRQNVLACREIDTQYSPIHDKCREVSGDEHEYILSRKLGALEIPFLSEDALRDLGFAKTVDFLLETPIAVYGPKGELRVIFWIDSKAMFGDPATHKENTPQLQGYVHRFGPGLVIYWTGYVEELNVHDDILLAQDLPTRFASLPRLQMHPSVAVASSPSEPVPATLPGLHSTQTFNKTSPPPPPPTTTSTTTTIATTSSSSITLASM